MHLDKILDPAAREYRVRYAVATILRDRVVNEGAFKNCFEMEDGDEVVRIILRRGLKNLRLRAALQGSHLINLNEWLVHHPDFAEGFYAPKPPDFLARGNSRNVWRAKGSKEQGRSRQRDSAQLLDCAVPGGTRAATPLRPGRENYRTADPAHLPDPPAPEGYR